MPPAKYPLPLLLLFLLPSLFIAPAQGGAGAYIGPGANGDLRVDAAPGQRVLINNVDLAAENAALRTALHGLAALTCQSVAMAALGVDAVAEDVAGPRGEGWVPVARMMPELSAACVCVDPWEHVPGRGCRKQSFNGGCANRTFAVPGGQAYQQGSPDAFSLRWGVDSVHIFAGAQHVWSYAVSMWSSPNCDPDPDSACPAVPGGQAAPAFVGPRFYCDSAMPVGTCLKENAKFYDKTLFADAPPFAVTLATPETAPLLVSICVNQDQTNEDIFVRMLSLSVK